MKPGCRGRCGSSMTDAPRLLPRLPLGIARELAAQMCERKPGELADRAAFEHEFASVAPTGGVPVGRAELASIRNEVCAQVEKLEGLQLPDLKRRSEFDLAVAEALYRSLPIEAGEASRVDVWSFLTCVVLPDMARWRYPDTEDVSRFIGGVRNTFQRLWWRARVLRDPEATDPLWLLRTLNEDQLVQIMERPNLRANVLLGRAIGRAMAGLNAKLPRGEVESLSRERVKLLRQVFPIVEFDSLEEGEIEELVSGVFGISAT